MTSPHIPLQAYQRLLNIARDLGATLDLDRLLDHIVHVAAELSNASAASILLYDPQRKILRFQTATNLSDTLQKGTEVPLENSIAGQALKRRVPIRRQEAQKDPNHYRHLDEVTHTQTKALIAIPLIAQEQPIGVLEAINKRDGSMFTDVDEEILTVLGAQAAVAIQNSRLFQQSDLISELVHEIRTPLGAILAGAQLLRLPHLPVEERLHTIDAIEHEARHLNELTTAFLDLARLESGRARFKRTQFDFVALTNEVMQLFSSKAAERDIVIAADVPPDLPPLYADRGKIRQVLINLVSNAIKYNKPGGQIRIAARHEPHALVFSVSDTGAGIPPEHQKHLFQKFYRVPGSSKKATGTGLGLHICKRIVEAHDGSILVESKVGKGTTFTVTLPQK